MQKIDYLDELHIANDWRLNTWSREDNKDLRGVMKKMKPGLLSVTNCDWKSMNKATIHVILQHVHTLILEECGLEQEHLLSILRTEQHLKVLKVNECNVRIDGEVLEAVRNLPSDIKLDIFDESDHYYGDIVLQHKSPTMNSMSI